MNQQHWNSKTVMNKHYINKIKDVAETPQSLILGIRKLEYVIRYFMNSIRVSKSLVPFTNHI